MYYDDALNKEGYIAWAKEVLDFTYIMKPKSYHLLQTSFKIP